MTFQPEQSSPATISSPDFSESEHATAPTRDPIPVHITGDAVQNIVNSPVGTNIVQVIQQLLGHAGRAALVRHEFTREALQVWRRAYEAVEEHTEIVGALAEPGSVVVLTAQRRSGRRTAAICALFDRNQHDPLIREIQVDEDVPLEVHKESVQHEESLILDLGDAGAQDELWRRTVRSLDAFSKVLEKKAARLVVIAPCGKETLDPSWYGTWIHVSAPQPLDVLYKHLMVRELAGIAQHCRGNDKIKRVLPDNAQPEDAARLAELVDETQAKSDKDVDRIISEAVDAFTDWADALREWFDQGSGQEPQARALITAVAAVEGADRETALNARDLLLESFERDLSADDDFFGPSITTRIGHIGALVEDDQVVFTKPGYGPAVLHHIWSERGRSSETVLKWMIRLPREHSLSDAVVNSLVDKLIVLADRHNDLRIIDTTVAVWTKDSATTNEFLEKLLTRAALSTQLGSRARRKLYELARPNSPVGAAVAAVCGGELAQVYPDIALVRLRRLAQHRASDVQTAVVNAMTRLADHQWSKALREAIKWAADADSRTVGVNCLAGLLRAKTNENTMSTSIIDRTAGNDHDDVVAAWSTLFSLQDTDVAVANAVGTWLDVAYQMPENREHVLRVLAEAGASNLLRLASLREWAIRWSGVRHHSVQPDLEERIDLREQLMAMAERMSVQPADEFGPRSQDALTGKDFDGHV